ncbi:hypothetical protein [Kitasatospora sp. NPDC059599]|uniref:hypothetical protein n=1 Tax=Kitasatospora sp. NPDC059599 TaxID=3346880 RepID=UPI0036CDDE82
MPERVRAADDFLAAGYEVRFDLSPVVLRAGRQADWAEPMCRMDDVLGPAVKAQAAAEIIMLTRNRDLHEVNPGRPPRAEQVLWRPASRSPSCPGTAAGTCATGPGPRRRPWPGCVR